MTCCHDVSAIADVFLKLDKLKTLFNKSLTLAVSLGAIIRIPPQ